MSKTVLIVEDNELNMRLFNDLVETRSCRILQTRDGAGAVDLARKYMPDLILMDIQLPGVSGLKVIEWLKEDSDLRSIPVVAVTAYAMRGDEERIRQSGCEAYLSKPISIGKFFETVDYYLAADRGEVRSHDRPADLPAADGRGSRAPAVTRSG